MQKKLWLNSHENARRCLARFIREFHQEENPDTPRYRCLTYMLKTLLDFFQFEKSIELESRIDRIEDYIEELKRCNTRL